MLWFKAKIERKEKHVMHAAWGDCSRTEYCVASFPQKIIYYKPVCIMTVENTCLILSYLSTLRRLLLTEKEWTNLWTMSCNSSHRIILILVIYLWWVYMEKILIGFPWQIDSRTSKTEGENWNKKQVSIYIWFGEMPWSHITSQLHNNNIVLYYIWIES